MGKYDDKAANNKAFHAMNSGSESSADNLIARGTDYIQLLKERGIDFESMEKLYKLLSKSGDLSSWDSYKELFTPGYYEALAETGRESYIEGGMKHGESYARFLRDYKIHPELGLPRDIAYSVAREPRKGLPDVYSEDVSSDIYMRDLKSKGTLKGLIETIIPGGKSGKEFKQYK